MTFLDLLPPIAFAVFAWWFSTGLILLVLRAPRAAHRGWLAVFAGIAVFAVAGVGHLAGVADGWAAYAGFVLAVVIWGWHEAAFLMGYVTGPRPAPCPDGARGFDRFRFATLTVLHHEIALAATLAALAALTWGQPNQTATIVFAVLFVMRLSAKFNLFLGVPNLSDEFMPPHLEHLKSYLPRRPTGLFMPISMTLGLVLAAWLMAQATAAAPHSAAAIGLVLAFALTLLALLEHAFMVLPVRDTALWKWATPRKDDGAALPDEGQRG